MSSDDFRAELRDLGPLDAGDLGADGATRIRTFRLILLMAQQMRTLMDQRLRPDGLTTQQAALLTAVDALGEPTLSQVAGALATTHQNARQIADALQRKGFLEIAVDPRDARVRRLRTTDAHAGFWARRNEGDHQAVTSWFSGLDPDEAVTLLALLDRVEGRLRDELGYPVDDDRPAR
ncbi:MAG: winged helix DNA-binding protein [Hamadaea sp.]|nr:winged helix DNA-binding protein [Hamadaea sp.]